MFNHPFIALKVPVKLEGNSAVKWYETVKTSGPENICAATEIKPDNKQVRFYMRDIKGHPTYIIPVARHLNTDEVKTISDTWNTEFPEGDFEITWSQDPQIDLKHQAVKEDVLKTVVLEAAKRAHSKWLNEKIDAGWKYGLSFDSLKKISPMCMPWDNLSEKYKLTEYRRMVGLVDVLNEMGLKISK